MFPYRDFLAGNLDECRRFLEIVSRETAKQTSKIILETGALRHVSAIAAATRLLPGYDVGFIKTSTGKTEVSATVGAANIILETIRDSGKTPVLKPAAVFAILKKHANTLPFPEVIMGETWPDPDHFRIGASSLLDDLIRVIEGETDMLPQEIIRKNATGGNSLRRKSPSSSTASPTAALPIARSAPLPWPCCSTAFPEAETTALTLKMRNSGSVLQWPELDAPVVDKHSSGGVGDKVSLMLAPMLAAAGVYVPMISGRGLGHTGGTLDKFDSIPGYQTQPDNDLFSRHGQRSRLCRYRPNRQPGARRQKNLRYSRRLRHRRVHPADYRFHTFQKLAAGLDCLIMDLKFGNGAFMNNLEEGRALARSIVKVANRTGTKTQALLTDMNQVLGTAAGNAVEMQEAVDYLKGQPADPRLHQVTMRLAARLLTISGQFSAETDALARLEGDLASGKALETFARMIAKLGGPADFTDHPAKYLPQAPVIRPVFSRNAGYVESMDTRNIGLQHHRIKRRSYHLGTKIDYSTGYTGFRQVGDYVDSQTPLAFVHAANQEDFARAAAELQNNITVSDRKPQPAPVIAETVE